MGVATRVRETADSVAEAVTGETIVCADCGQRFAVNVDPALQTAELTKKRASWVAEQLVWDHIQERKHHGTIKLPAL
jgi:hypothetical protein